MEVRVVLYYCRCVDCAILIYIAEGYSLGSRRCLAMLLLAKEALRCGINWLIWAWASPVVDMD